MFGFGGSKKDDSQLGFGVPNLSLGNPGKALGKATNTLRNTGEKVENFLFGRHGSRTETHIESSGGGFGLGDKGGLSLGLNVPTLGTPNIPKVPKFPKSSHGFGLPSLSNLGREAKNDLEKAGTVIENTGKKAIDFLFGGHKKKPSLPGLEIDIGGGIRNPSVPPNGISLNGNLGSVKANDTSLGVSLGKGKSSIGASLSLPNLNGVGSEIKNDLGRVEGAVENTGKEAIDFLFGHGKGESPSVAKTDIDLNAPSIPSLGISFGEGDIGLPNLPKGNLKLKHNLEKGTSSGLSLDIEKGNLDANLPSLGVNINGTGPGNLGSNGTSLGISLGNGKSSIGASLSLPNLSTPTDNLDKVGGAIGNTGKKAKDFLFGHGKGDSPSVAKTDIDLNAPSIPSLGISFGEGDIGLPNLPKGNLKLKHNLEKGTSSGLSFDIEKGNLDANLPSLGVNINGTGPGNLGSNGTSLGISLGNGKSSIGASLSLPHLSTPKDNLDKVGGAIENTGKKALDFLFGHGKGDSTSVAKTDIDLNAPSIPSLGISFGEGDIGLPNMPKGNLKLKHNLDKGTSSGLSLDIEKGNLDASVPSLGVNINGTNTGNLRSNGTSLGISLANGKTSIGASLSLPNLSTPTDNLNKLDDAIEKTGKNAMNFLPSITNTTSNGKQNGPTGLSGSLLEETSSTSGVSDEKSIGLPDINLPNLGAAVLVDMGSTNADNTHTNIPLSLLPNLSSTVSLNKGAVPGTPLEGSSTTDQPFKATSNPQFEDLDKIFYTNNISIIDDGATSPPSTYDADIISEIISAKNGSSTLDYDEETRYTEDSTDFSGSTEPINNSTENYSIFNGNGNGFSLPYNITTESEKDLKKIEETLRGSLDANSPTTSSTQPTVGKAYNVTSKTQTETPTTESINPVPSSTLEYSSNQTSTTEKPKKPKPAVIPPYFLVPNSNVTFGEGFEPVLPPSVFDNPTGKKAPFIPILPSSPNTNMGPYNFTDRGVANTNSPVASNSDNLSAVTYGAIGVGTIAIISIILAFIYKAIQKARRSSSGGSYSPKSHHKEQEETRRSSSNSDANSAVVDSQVGQTIITHAVVNESIAEAKKNTRNLKSRAPDPQKDQDEILKDNTNQSDFNHPGTSNSEVLNLELTYDHYRQNEKTHQQDSTNKEIPTGGEGIIQEQIILKKNITPIDKPPRKLDKTNASIGKFTSDKTAASNLNEDSLRSLGQALGGILKDQMPDLDGNHKVGNTNIKKEKDFANNSDELISCTPPTTPTDLSDQETTKTDNKVEENRTQKKSNAAGGDVDGDTFFSSGEMEVDTGSEYFSADEITYGVKEPNVRSPVASHSRETHSNGTLSNENGLEFVRNEGRRKSIEEDIADSLKSSTKTEDRIQEKLITIDAVKTTGHHRCISMCEDQTIDMEVQEILKGKEPYQIPSENSSAKDSAEFQTSNQKEKDEKHIMEEMYQKNAPGNSHLQNIVDSGTQSYQNNSALDANTVVDEIMSTSKLNFSDTDLKTFGNTQNIEGTKVHLEENILNMNNSNQNFFIQSKTTILDVEISGETMDKINDETSKTTDTPEQRNLIDYIVPKHVSNETASFDASREDQPKQGLAAANITEGESSTSTPKWYVPFESSPQELTDPTRGNSDGLYIALSDESKVPQVKTENQTQYFNSTSGSTKKSCLYININGDRSGIDEGWPSHIPKNHNENNISGLDLLNTSLNGHKCTIHEESIASSNKHGKPYNETSDLLSKQAEISITNSVLAGANIHQDIPKFELPNMDKRLTRKRNLKRRQIKSLDSGVHGYYGEYIDLVEFPELDGDQKMTQDTERKTNEEINKNEFIDREIKEIKIEEDVVTILPDGSIREEKIVIDKISST